jgi:hypothetical protein
MLGVGRLVQDRQAPVTGIGQQVGYAPLALLKFPVIPGKEILPGYAVLQEHGIQFRVRRKIPCPEVSDGPRAAEIFGPDRFDKYTESVMIQDRIMDIPYCDHQSPALFLFRIQRFITTGVLGYHEEKGSLVLHVLKQRV